MQSFDDQDYGRSMSAFVRRRLAEATLSQDHYDGSAWAQLDPGPPAVKSLSQKSQSLHQGLLGNALDHIDEYMNQETYELPVGDFLEARLGGNWSSRMPAHLMSEGIAYTERQSASSVAREAEGRVEVKESQQMAEMSEARQPEQSATITYYSDDGMLKTVQGVDLNAVTKRCPLLAMAFEESRSGPQLFLETLSSRTAEPFSRFLNTGSYAAPSEEWNSGGMYEDVPTSVLLHVELFRLGDLYSLPDLKSQAYVNVLRQCEFGCSSPEKPIDLSPAIRFVYAYLDTQEQLKDAIIHYCVACFLRHRLGEDADFKQLAYDLRPFHQELCKNCMDRGYEMETASAIIQMPFKVYRPDTYASTENHPFVDDVVYHFHANDEMDSPKKRRRAEKEAVLPIRSLSEAKTEGKTDQDAFANMEQKFSQEGRPYLVDHSTRTASWTADLEQQHSPEGRAYLVDHNTRTTRWVDPRPAQSTRAHDQNADSNAEEQASFVDAARAFVDYTRQPTSGASADGSVSPMKSEDEFEGVDLDDIAEKAANSDSESSDWVDVLTENPKTPRRSGSMLTLRSGAQAAVDPFESSESESDWSEVQGKVRQVEGNESDSEWSMV